MVELDLREILEGSHIDRHEAYSVKGNCKCGVEIEQTQFICHNCNEPISWRHSPLFTASVLQAEAYPKNKAFLSLVGVKRFINGREFHRFRKVSEHYATWQIADTVDWCRNTLKKQNGSASGRALMRFTLNTLEKRMQKSGEEGEILGRLGE
jgi:hypothetical protein